MRLRDAAPGDVDAMRDLYNPYVRTSTCTFQVAEETREDRLRWLEAHGGPHPAIVACEGDRVIGWGSLSPWSAREGYRRTVEDSVYVDAACHGRGVGRAILTELVARAEAHGHHTVIGVVAADQAASVALHERLGFVRVSRLREVGFKLGRWIDVVHLQRML